MANEFLYKRAPLIEVVAEIHWELRPLLAIPNAAVDPHLPVLTDQFAGLLKQGGYTRVERLVPEQMPTEMFPHRPLLRYRRASEEWPLIQLGPGLLAINIVPPYRGWSEFRRHVAQATEWLFTAYPMPEKYLKIETLELRYIDAFARDFGYHNYLEFLDHKLMLGIHLPTQIASLSDNPQDGTIALEIRIPIAGGIGATATIKVAPGKVKDADALLMELICKREQAKAVDNPKAIVDWMDGAHNLLHETFDRLLSEQLKNEMGPLAEVGETAHE